MNPSDKYEQIKDIKRLNPVELESMVLKHEQQIKDIAEHLLELRKWGSPMMEFKQEMPKTLTYDSYDSPGPSYKHVPYPPDPPKEWVGLTDEELLDAYGWKEKVEKNRFWEDTNPMLEKARQDMLVGLRKVESLLKEKNGG